MDGRMMNRTLVDDQPQVREHAAVPDRLMVRSEGRIRFIDVDQVHWAEAEGNYVRVHTPDGSLLIRHTMNDLLARLGRDRFLRIHRSRIVRIDRIVELRFSSGGEYDVVMKDGVRLGMSRYCRRAVQERLLSGAPAS
jgi:two-component system LytT family response regulator